MDCDAVRDRLTLLADGDLPAEETLAVRRHLTECEGCGAVYRDLVRLSEELRGLPRPPVPDDLRSRVALALDAAGSPSGAASRSNRSLVSLAAPYLAAAAVIAVAFALASMLPHPGQAPSRVAKTIGPARSAQRSATTGQPQQLAAESPVEAEAGDPPGDRAAQEAVAVRDAMAAIEELQKGREIQERDEEILRTLPPALGEPSGGGIVSIPPHGEVARGGPSAKPPGTFAAEGGPPGIAPAVAPSEPTSIALAFVPPSDPTVGQTAQGSVEISSRETIPEAVVTAEGDEGLRVEKPAGVLYRGPLRAGETVRVPLPMVASKSGSHELEIGVESAAPGGSGKLKVFVPSFRSAPAPRPETSAGDKPVSLVFKNVPIRQALMDIGRKAKLRVEIPEDLGTERISRDVRGVPAKAALRAIAEAGGYDVTEAEGVYQIKRAASTSPD